MSLFGRRETTTTRAAGVPPLGSGRRLESDLDIENFLACLDAVLRSYREPKYKHMPTWVNAGVRPVGPSGEMPHRAVACDDSDENFMLVGLWYEGAGTTLGLFPLGAGDARLSGMSIEADLKRYDGSLRSTGLWPPGLLALQAPVVPDNYLHATLATAGFRATEGNVAGLGNMIVQMLLVKAHEFIGSRDSRAAEDFVDSHLWAKAAGVRGAQAVLDDLGAWNPGVLPYIQELPMRVRAIVLDGLDQPGTFWDSMER